MTNTKPNQNQMKEVQKLFESNDFVALEKKLVHAYGPFKKVLIMPIKKTINRIYETANLKVIGIRRIK